MFSLDRFISKSSLGGEGEREDINRTLNTINWDQKIIGKVLEQDYLWKCIHKQNLQHKTEEIRNFTTENIFCKTFEIYDIWRNVEVLSGPTSLVFKSK